MKFGLGQAQAVILFIIVAVVSILQVTISRKGRLKHEEEKRHIFLYNSDFTADYIYDTLYLLVINTFKTTQEFVLNPFSFPKTFELFNYKEAIRKMNFVVSFKNTLIISVATVLLNTFFSSMIAYVFSRKDWKINKILFLSLVVSMVAPFQVYMIPLVKIYGGMLGMSNNLAIVIYVGIGLTIPFSVFLYRGFLNSIRN